MSTYREERYTTLLKQVESLVSGEFNLIANMANLSAAIYAEFQFHWVGFYLVEDNELVLGPFQGPVACTRIKKGRGVCGTAWAKNEVQIVANVNEFPGHIACSPYSCSEIVLPVEKDGQVIAVLDIDSEEYNSFTELDATYLNKLIALLVKA